MLKTTELPDKLASSRNDGSRSASSKNNDSKLASERNSSNNEVNGLGVDRNGVKHAKKSGKLSKSENLSKSRQSKREQLSKSQKSANSEKKSSKSENLPNFDIKKNGPSFLISDARMTFNYLQLAFTKAPIFWHFDPECYIWIETNTLSYAINGMLS